MWEAERDKTPARIGHGLPEVLEYGRALDGLGVQASAEEIEELPEPNASGLLCSERMAHTQVASMGCQVGNLERRFRPAS